jgi:hypothetical protein
VSSIERIRAKSTHVKASRKCFYKKLEELQKILADVLSNIEVYAQSQNVTLETISPDDSVYGHLYFSQGKLKIAYRSTEDDFIDSMNNVSNEDWSYDVKDLTGCPIGWLERLSGKRAIDSLMTDLERALEYLEEDSRESINVLELALNSQSNKVSDSLVEELKKIDDSNLHRAWLKARNQIQIDAADSINRTSSFLESICRMILSGLSETLPPKKDISSLIGATVKALGLSGNKEADNDLKQLVGGVKSIFQSVGSLRTHFGTAHGSSPGDYVVNESHARLASDASAAVSNFLLHRYKQKLNKTN